MAIEQTGHITLSDVRAALADTDPNTTNAGALRTILGRGSFATIQKYLDAIRAERVEPQPVAPGAIPAAPVEAVSAIWSAAWAHAQAQTLGRLEIITVQRDAAAELSVSQARDISALAGEVDTLTGKIEGMTLEHSKELEETQDKADKAGLLAAEQTAALEKVEKELAQVQHEAQQAAVLADREAQIRLQTLQTVLDKAISEVSEYKSLLARLKPFSGDSAAG